MSTLKRKSETAKELMDRLSADPDYVARIEAKEQARLARMAQHIALVQPLIKELKAAGFEYNSLDDLRCSGTRYVDASPILVKWLPLMKDPNIKESNNVRDSIVRTLMIPWAKPFAVQPMLEAFRAEPPTGWTTVKWTMASALEMYADDSMYEELAELIQDRRHGDSRAVLTQALGKMKNPKAVDLLIDLLDDDEVYGSALQALRKLATEKARPHFERLLTHWSKNLQREARKGLEKLDKKAAKKK